MPDRHVYLSHHNDTYLTAYCPLCSRRENYAVPDIIKKTGDCQIVGLKTTIGNLWGCRKVYNLDHDHCRLDVSIGGKLEQPGSILMSKAELQLQKIGAWRAPEHIDLEISPNGSTSTARANADIPAISSIMNRGRDSAGRRPWES